LAEGITYCINGQLAIDKCKDLLDKAIDEGSSQEIICPVSLMILDF